VVRRRTRREVMLTAGRGGVRLVGAGLALGSIAALLARTPRRRPLEVREMGILRPPGALDEDAFLSTCIRCTLCADACPPRCIGFFDSNEGRVAGTPRIVAEDRACTGCLACTTACPSGALVPLNELTEIAMGVALVDERLCVSHNGTGVCGACHTVCPVRSDAITQGARNAPTVHAEFCIGCGLCEEACIVDDRRAIRVVSNRSWS
jgi:ferredoxin-type protein NapG